ncbi:glutathione S-transferase family protein [Sphingopyxis fribergensis]
MAGSVHLYGYRYSVYSRTVRLALLSKRVEHETIETNPFDELPTAYLALHPFGRVPMLTHGAFQIFETNSITRYIDRAFEGPLLQPRDTAALARMDQVMAVIDAYIYWPMVRQVSSHGFFRPLTGERADRAEIDSGLAALKPALSFLDEIAAEGEVLSGCEISLADWHLAPMMDYFVRTDEGAAALASHSALQRWWDRVSVLDVMRATDPMGAGPFDK